MKLCRFAQNETAPRIGMVVDSSTLVDLTPAGITRMEDVLEAEDPSAQLKGVDSRQLPKISSPGVKLLAPVERQEIWAAGVTYLRSKTARMDESEFSATAYDRVYEAPRPELFFKSLPEKVAGPADPVGIRKDARWSVPEPELALAISSRGRIVGYTIGNDMSSRDIEGENLLYLPQAKTYRNSCAIGPFIFVGAPETTARSWTIRLAIERAGQVVFAGETSVNQIKRSFQELVEYLFRSQVFPHGAILLTGTGLVPPDTFTLQDRDWVEIEVSSLGLLRNQVTVV
jgi:2-dehydro-3-deoxy-D-arabinonate dehydratase